MLAEMVERLDGKVFSGPNGQPLAITGIDLVERTNNTTGDKKFMLQLSGVATDYLVDSNNPAAGSESIGENVAVVMERSIEEPDNEIWLKQLNQAFDLSGDAALVDGPDWVERFVEGTPNSVVATVREKGLYVKAKKKNDFEKAMAYGNSPFFFNPHVIPMRVTATSDNLAIIREKLNAMRAAKAAAEKEKAAKEKALFGG
jgi:hypothetical protein